MTAMVKVLLLGKKTTKFKFLAYQIGVLLHW